MRALLDNILRELCNHEHVLVTTAALYLWRRICKCCNVRVCSVNRISVSDAMCPSYNLTHCGSASQPTGKVLAVTISFRNTSSFNSSHPTHDLRHHAPSHACPVLLPERPRAPFRVPPASSLSQKEHISRMVSLCHHRGRESKSVLNQGNKKQATMQTS